MTTQGLSIFGRALRKIKRVSIRARERLRGLPLRAVENKRGRPIPPGRLIYLVANTEDVSWYLQSGAKAAKSIRDVLLKNGVAIEDFTSILDFGCGVARVIREWDLPGKRIVGTDYNPLLINWCRSKLTHASFDVNPLDKPLDYPAESFDFIYCLSVFTHLSEPVQDFWMDELFRILKPGGFLLITTHGDHYIPMLQVHERESYLAGNSVVQKSDREGSNDCAAFHPPSYVRGHLARRYELIEMIPEGALGNPSQDLYLLKKS